FVRVTHAAAQCRPTTPDDRCERGGAARVPCQSAGPVTRPGAPDTRSAAAGPVSLPADDPRSTAPHADNPASARPARVTKTCLPRTSPARSRGRQTRVGGPGGLSAAGGWPYDTV